MKDFPLYASVIVDLKLDKALDYGVPEQLVDKVKPGVKVLIPVRGKLRSGFVFELKKEKSYPKLLPIKEITSGDELMTEELFSMALWMTKYYGCSLSQVLKSILPSSVRKEIKPKEQLWVMRAKTRDEIRKICIEIRNKNHQQAAILDEMLKVKKGIFLSELLTETGCSKSPVDTLVKKGVLAIDIVRVDRSPLVNEVYLKTKPKKLTGEQAHVLEKINATLDQNRFETHLLHGVTGSGKTEVYLQAIDWALKQNKSAIMLIPEISLTAQTIERFRSRFSEPIAILHSRLSDGERFDAWKKIQRGDIRIVIGARSAIFSPIKNLGIIIVDEEHEGSYKQTEEAPCYHARDLAVVRAKFANATCILGSATPSFESYYNAKAGKYTLSTLTTRAEASQRPTVTIVDMKKEYEKNKGFTNFSAPLIDAIEKRHKLGEQVILFLNRRGYHTTQVCTGCGEAVKCRHCDVVLTYHQNQNQLACHLCGYFLKPPPEVCPGCKCQNPMKFRGVGTELLEKSLKAVLPDIRTTRVDADTTRHKGAHQKLLKDFATGKADVLIGTQMIAKGLHFSEVTLVGVINCDASLNIPDFRASETAFQLLTQVSGRAGRGASSGEVILQTTMPENSTIALAAKQDFEPFYTQEIAAREMFGFPPFLKIVKITFSGEDEKRTFQFADRLKQATTKNLTDKFRINPVVASGHAKVKDRYRFQLLIFGPSVPPIHKAIEKAKAICPLPSKMRMLVDVNPLSTFF